MSIGKKLYSLFSPNTMEFRREPEERTIQAQDLLSLVGDWSSDVQRRTSEKSAKSSVYQIRPFVVWFEEFAIAYDYELSRESMLDFYGYLRNDYRTTRGKPAEHNGQANCLSKLKAFFRWAFRTGRADMDISMWVPTMAQKARRSRLLSRQALMSLFDAAGGGKNPIRDRCMIALFAGTGARSIEVFNAQLDPGFLELHADKSGSVFFAVTKNDNPRLSVFGPNTGRMVEAWMDHCGRESGPIWGNDLSSPKMLYEVISRCAGRAGFGKMGPHDIRKLFCSHWYREYDPSDARAQYFLGLQVGHRGNGVTQQHYVNCTAEDILPFYVSPFESQFFAEFIDAI